MRPRRPCIFGRVRQNSAISPPNIPILSPSYLPHPQHIKGKYPQKSANFQSRISPLPNFGFLAFSLQFAILLLTLFSSTVLAQSDPKPALRILRDQCLGCHKPGKAKGGLLLTTREKSLKGGDTGPAFVPGKAADSLVYQLALKEGDPHMPPKKQLSDTDLAALKTWIDSGAVWDASVFDELPTVKPLALNGLPKNYQPVLALALSPDEHLLAVTRGNVVAIHDLAKSD
ncbi:MAG TPA: c-type cytochrome domain-containing protein, partial [Prosthecobacter sp.]|nr:c-type cytochrome domain-containing protein [Prosthecobacter sp.]